MENVLSNFCLTFLIALSFCFIQCNGWPDYFSRFELFGKSSGNAYKSVKPAFNPRNPICGHSKYWKPASFYENELYRSPLGITGGSDAQPNEFPHQVAFLVTRGGMSGKCGGSVISESWVMTAGHCCANIDSAEIVYGTNNLKDQSATRRFVQPSNVFVHPFYNKFMFAGHDFCLIKVDEPVSFSDWRIRPICLPDSCEETCQGNEIAVTTGFGLLNPGENTNQLQKVDVTVCSDDACSNRYGAYFNREIMVCAGNTTQTGGTCKGDSGGPLNCFKNGYFTLQGVTSFGSGSCASPDSPPVYAKVCAVREWIESTMQKGEWMSF